METFLFAPSEGELEIVLVGVGVAIANECTAAAWHDDANAASMVSVAISRISFAWLGYTGRWDRGGCEGNGNRSIGSYALPRAKASDEEYIRRRALSALIAFPLRPSRDSIKIGRELKGAHRGFFSAFQRDHSFRALLAYRDASFVIWCTRCREL